MRIYHLSVVPFQVTVHLCVQSKSSLFYLRQGLKYVATAGPELAIWTGWPRTASASHVLELNICVNIPC